MLATAQKSPSSEADLKRQAEKAFGNENYESATLQYSQLLSLYPQNTLYNFRYGVCILMSGKDKELAVVFLEKASRDKNADNEVWFYLARANMSVGHYTEAIGFFEKFKTLSLSRATKLNTNQYITYCNNAIELKKRRRMITVLSEQEVSQGAFYSVYDFGTASGRLLATPEKFLTSDDRDKIKTPLMFLAKDGQTVFYASYGRKATNGKDIYRIVKLPNGSWSSPVNIGNEVNTQMDEDYPYLDKDGRTLYFCSKGHNSIGGYDIFKSQYDYNSGKWSEPENLGIPINTSEDDIFFLPNTTGEHATYATAPASGQGKITVHNVELGDMVNQVAVISGVFVSQDQMVRRDARISIVRKNDNGVITSVNTDPQTGAYELIIPPSTDYMIVVEAGGYLPHAENFSIPMGINLSTIKQKVVMKKESQSEKMTVSNYFTPLESEARDMDSAVASVPSQVIMGTYNLNDSSVATMKMITVDGKTLYVTPPTSNIASVELKTELAPIKSMREDTIAFDTKENDGGYVITKEGEAAKHNSERKDLTDYSKINNEKNNSQQETTAAKNENENKKEQPAEKNTPKEKVYTENISNAELVKISFDDARMQKEDAVYVVHQVLVKKEEAKTFDELARVQMKEAQQIISTGGDAEKAKQLTKDSKGYAEQSQTIMKAAVALEAEAKAKQKDADKAMADATKLMKKYKVDTSAVAYRTAPVKTKSVKLDDAEKEQTSVAQNQNATADKSVEKIDENKSDTSSQNISAENLVEQKQTEEEIAAVTENEHSVKATALQDESDSLGMLAMEMKQRSHNLSDKRKRDGLLKLSKTLRKQSDDKQKEANKELAIMKQEEKEKTKTDLALKNKEALNKKAEEKKQLADVSKVNDRSEAKNQEKKKNDMKKNSDSLVVSKTENANALQSSSDKSKVENQKQILNENRNVAEQEADTINADSGKDTGEESLILRDKINGENKTEVAGNNNPVVPEKIADKQIAEGKVETQDEKIISKPLSEEIIIAPAAKLAYDIYKEKSRESGQTAKQAQELQQQADEAQPSYKRDSLTAKANELSNKSIMLWMDSQHSLKKAKEMDVDVEKKIKLIETQNEVAGNKPTTKNETAKNDVSDIDNSSVRKNNTEENTAVEKTLTFAEQKKRNEATEISVNEKVENDTTSIEPPIALDTTAKEYPKYVELSRQIKSKQGETVNIFIEGMQLNKRAILMKEKELKLRDEAATAPDAKTEKEKLTQAEVLKHVGDSVKTLSQQKLAIAQNSTREVKTLTAKADVIKKKITVKQVVSKPSQQILAESKNQKRVGNKQASEINSNDKQKSADKSLGENKEQITSVSGENKNKELVNYSETNSSKGNVKKEAVDVVPQNVIAEKIPDATEEKSPPVKVVVVENRSQPQKESADTISTTAKLIAPNYIVNDSTTYSMGKGDAYSETNPIPVDPALPDGLVFKVQIGAFHSPLPANTFKNMEPVTGENSRPGWIRYCVGLFRTFEPANLLKKEVRGIGYRDAFVVAYFNGKRIGLYEAYSIISKAALNEKRAYSLAMQKEFEQLKQFQILSSSYTTKPDDDTKTFYGTTNNVSSLVDVIEFAVQVGVYKTSKIPTVLTPLQPLNTEQTPSNLFRFTTGHFIDYALADSMKRVAITTGVKDAFIVVYKNGFKVGGSATSYAKQLSGNTTARKKSDEIISSSQNKPQISSDEKNTATAKDIPSVYKPSEIYFKVQLGAFRESVPVDVMNSFLKISDKGISQDKNEAGLSVFYAGNFNDYNSSLNAKNEIVMKGVSDAFVVAFAGSKKITIAEAIKILSK